MIAAADVARGGMRAMSAAELDSFLGSCEWGVLAVSAADGPYAVPVSYGYANGTLFLTSGPGRKLDAIEEDPRVCLTIASVMTGADWRCVVARGTLRPVDSLVERARALHAIARTRSGGLSPADLARAARARVFRKDLQELSGRRRD